MIPQEVAEILDWLRDQFIFAKSDDIEGLARDLYNRLFNAE